MGLSFESTTLDIPAIRRDFPILERETEPGVKLVYLDNAATSQKPVQVIEAMDLYYRQMNANIHRGIHCLAEEATVAYEDGRKKIASFIGAESWREIVFTRNTTESLNLLAYSWGRANLKAGDRILLTEMEHHSNIVPWQMLASEVGVTLDFVTLTDQGMLNQESYATLLEREPKLVSFTQMSNMLGTINPVTEMTEQAHRAGAVVIIDAAQSVPHMPVDVQELGADFMVFSAHKMLGPTGIGILYGRKELLQEMPPFLGGGDMIKRVQLGGFTMNDLPYKFEAGTPAIAEGIGFGEAVDYLANLGMEVVHQYEQALTAYALERLEEVPGIQVYGPEAQDKGGVLSFTYDGIHTHDVAHILDSFGIAIRAGHHCAQPAHQHFDIDATSRASFYIYNVKEEVDHLIEGLYKVKEIFG
ncbi:MAG: cysteine desulfurase [Anaerolineales bacterium]|nr:MAG: cysteine desulfurase [Anaerolineales bacterium]